MFEVAISRHHLVDKYMVNSVIVRIEATVGEANNGHVTGVRGEHADEVGRCIGVGQDAGDSSV